MAKKNYVIDTSVFLSDADALFAFENNDVFIPLKVLMTFSKSPYGMSCDALTFSRPAGLP